MTPLQVALGVLVGFLAGTLSGLFGVGGGIVTTPAVNVLLGGTAIQAIATPLPVILPTSIAGGLAYARAGEVSFRAARWAIPPGVVGAVVGALLTERLNAHALLVLTSVLIGWTAVQLIRGRAPRIPWVKGETPGWKHAAIGLVAGFVSGLLGVGGGIVMVPAFTVFVGMPLKRALGTSLVVIAALVIPGTLVHWWLGHIDWAIFLVLSIGVVPGARLGARIALGAREHVLRLTVGTFLLLVGAAYGVSELAELLSTRG
ncbi:MAG TPA: sulfite exporter TauE/SafE family protein [Actinomycetota bacterium]|nr:sulfite exporter TauE/SafE family protein [Actinomycetota bacterium]